MRDEIFECPNCLSDLKEIDTLRQFRRDKPFCHLDVIKFYECQSCGVYFYKYESGILCTDLKDSNG